MAKKTYTGADIKAFFQDPAIWTAGGASEKGFYIEEDYYVVDGKEYSGDEMHEKFGDDCEHLDDAAAVQIGGFLRENNGGSESYDLAATFKKWVETNSVQRLVAVFEVPKDLDAQELQTLKDTLTSLGAKLSGAAATPAPAARKPRP